MTRARIGTTLEGDLLSRAGRARAGASDAVLVDEALAALLARNRAAEVDPAWRAQRLSGRS